MDKKEGTQMKEVNAGVAPHYVFVNWSIWIFYCGFLLLGTFIAFTPDGKISLMSISTASCVVLFLVLLNSNKPSKIVFYDHHLEIVRLKWIFWRQNKSFPYDQYKTFYFISHINLYYYHRCLILQPLKNSVAKSISIELHVKKIPEIQAFLLERELELTRIP